MEEEEKQALAFEGAGRYILTRKYERECKIFKVFAYVGLAILIVGLFLFLLILSDTSNWLYLIPGIVVSSLGLVVSLGTYIPYIIIFTKRSDWIKKNSLTTGRDKYEKVLKEIKGHDDFASPNKENIFIVYPYIEKAIIRKQETYTQSVSDKDGVFTYEGKKHHLEFTFKDGQVLKLVFNNRYYDDQELLEKLIDFPLEVDDSVLNCPICDFSLNSLQKGIKTCLNCEIDFKISE